MDGVNPWGRTSDITVVGMRASDLDDVLRDAAALQNRTLNPDPEPEKGSYKGVKYIGKDEKYSKTKRDEYTANDYHKPSDHIKPDWDLSGAVEDAQLLWNGGVARPATALLSAPDRAIERDGEREISGLDL